MFLATLTMCKAMIVSCCLWHNLKLTSLHFLPHLRQPNAVAVTASHGPATLANLPASASYKDTVNYLYSRAKQHILQLEKDAYAKIQRQAEEALAAAHQWQSTATSPEFTARLVKEDPMRIKSQLRELEEDINNMHLGVPFHWVRKFCGFRSLSCSELEPLNLLIDQGLDTAVSRADSTSTVPANLGATSL